MKKVIASLLCAAMMISGTLPCMADSTGDLNTIESIAETSASEAVSEDEPAVSVPESEPSSGSEDSDDSIYDLSSEEDAVYEDSESESQSEAESETEPESMESEIDELEPIADFWPESPSSAAELLGASVNNVVEDGGVYIIRLAANKKVCLDVQGGKADIRTNVHLYTENYLENQKWFAVKNSDGTLSFVSCGTGRALDLEGNDWADGSNIQIHTPRLEDAQKWNLVDAGSGSYYIQHAESGKVLTAAGSSSRDNIYLQAGNGAAVQKFILEKSSVDSAAGELVMCQDTAPSNAVTISGGKISLSSRVNTKEQTFIVSSSGSGYYTIKNKADGKYLSVGDSSKPGTAIIESTTASSPRQQWHVVRSSTGTYIIFSRVSNQLCLAVRSGKLLLESYHDTSGQKFYLRNVNESTYSGVHIVKSSKYPDKAMDVYGGSTANGANVQVYNNNWSDGQAFKFEKVPGLAEEVYYIICVKSGKAVSYIGTASKGTTVVQCDLTKNDSQKWLITTNGDGAVSLHPYTNTALALDLYGGNIADETDIILWTNNGGTNQNWYLGSRRITECKLTSANTIQVTGKANRTPSYGDDGKVYLFAKDNLAYLSTGKTPLASSVDGENFKVSSGAVNIRNYINQQFFVGIIKDGKYYITSNGMYITNPEAAASKKTARTKPLNKKGLAIYWDKDKVAEAINTLHVKNVALNLPISQIISGTYPYTYKNKTYYFNNLIPTFYKQRVAELNAAGIQVTLVTYLEAGVANSNPQYVTPDARTPIQTGAASPLLAGMNAQEQSGRDALEAIFAFLADTFSDSNAHVDNFVIGNELDDPVHWNYCGPTLPLDKYVTYYTQVYRLAYNTMKSIWSNVEVYDSLDHVWTTTSRGSSYYTAKGFQDKFNTTLNEEGAINWGLAFHPYCTPEQDPRFWNGASYGQTQDGATTPTVSLYNLGAFASYCTSKYGSSHHIILSETGISAKYNGVNMENQQAAAIAYGYYITEMTNGIDNLIIHCYQDTKGETDGGWYLGIRRTDGSARPSYNVLAKMDSKANGIKVTTPYVKWINNASSWTSLLPGLDINKFGDSRY